MEHDRRIVNEASDKRFVGNGADNQVDRGWQRFSPAREQVIEDGYSSTSFGEPANELTADEPGATRDENTPTRK